MVLHVAASRGFAPGGGTEAFTGGIYAGTGRLPRLGRRLRRRDHESSLPQVSAGVHGEKSFALDGGGTDLDRAVVWARYVFDESASMYTAPMHHVEVFGSWQQNFLPLPRYPTPGASASISRATWASITTRTI